MPRVHFSREMPAASRLRTCSDRVVCHRPTPDVSQRRRSSTPARARCSSTARPPPASRTASVLKVLTAAAALNILGPDYPAHDPRVRGQHPRHDRARRRRRPDAQPPAVGHESVYAGRAEARRPRRRRCAYKPRTPSDDHEHRARLHPVELGRQVGLRPGSAPSRPTATISEVTALQVDGDRDDPTAADEPAQHRPGGRAGAGVRRGRSDAATSTTSPSRLGVGGRPPSRCSARSSRSRSACSSARCSSTATTPSPRSLARVISKQMGLGGSSASLQQAIPQRARGLRRRHRRACRSSDGSGLSAAQRGAARSSSPQLMVEGHARRPRTSTSSTTRCRSRASRGTLAEPLHRRNAVAAGKVIGEDRLDRHRLHARRHHQRGRRHAARLRVLRRSATASRTTREGRARHARDRGVYTCGDNLSNN